MAGEGASEGWYVRARGRVQGPLTWTQLLAMRERGQLARFDQLSRDGQTWTAADSVEGLFPSGGPAGAFVGSAPAKGQGRKRGPEAESVGFLILDDDEPAAVGGLGPAAAPADDPMGWYYAEAGLPQGPVGFSELKGLAKDGRIGPGTLYWRSGLDQWTTGSDIPELNVLWRYEAGPDAAAAGVTLPPRSRNAEPGRADAALRSNPLATISVALNLFCGVGSLAAIVVGVVALRQIARSNGTIAGKALAVAGVALGVAGLAICAMAYVWFFARGPR
jgi:hypothetical protein